MTEKEWALLNESFSSGRKFVPVFYMSIYARELPARVIKTHALGVVWPGVPYVVLRINDRDTWTITLPISEVFLTFEEAEAALISAI